MATYPSLTLLAQAMLALPFMLPIIFAVLFCGVYIVLILVNTVFALVNGYRRKPPQLLLARKTMVVTGLVVAALICGWFLFSLNGHFY
jgi:hypothetical protein